MNHYGIIYKRTCIVNGKFYYGKTTQTEEKRWIGHVRGAKNPKCYFHRAIKKFGAENFIGEVIEYCSNKDQLNEREKYYIARDKSYNKEIGYNLTMGGDGGAVVGEALEKLKKSLTGRKRTDQSIMMSGKNNPMYGKHHNQNSKNMISAANTGRISWCKGLTKETDYRVNNRSMKRTGKKHSEITKKRMSDNHYNCSGKNNPMYGVIRGPRCWINNTKQNKFVKKESLNCWLDSGWIKGILSKT